jgi:hypothetical protein
MICGLALLLAATSGCRKSSTVAEYDVLSAFVDNEFVIKTGVKPTGQESDRITKVVISNSTESDQHGSYVLRDGNGQPVPWAQIASSLQKEDPNLGQKTLDAFREANIRQTSLQRLFHPAVDYEIVDDSSSQLRSVFRSGGWPAFYKLFPGSQGILTFSRVGFSPDGVQALLYVKNRCGDLCGGSAYVVLERHNDHWLIEKEIDEMVS